MTGDHRPVTDHGHALQQRPIGCERQFSQIAVQSRDGRRVAGLDFLHVCVCDSNGCLLTTKLNGPSYSITPSARPHLHVERRFPWEQRDWEQREFVEACIFFDDPEDRQGAKWLAHRVADAHAVLDLADRSPLAAGCIPPAAGCCAL